MWTIKIKSKNQISDEHKEILIDYACSEGDKIILHDVLETHKSLELIIETEKENAKSFFAVLNNDYGYNISLSKII